MKIFIALSFLFLSLPAFAGAWSSGGGSAVICFTDPSIAELVNSNKGLVTNEQLDKIDSIEAFDLFEWQLPRGIAGTQNLVLAEPKPGEKYPDFLKRLTDRANETISFYSSETYAAVGNYLETMQGMLSGSMSDHIVWTGTSLVDLQDSGTPMRFGGNCALVPMAVQVGSTWEDLRIFVDDRLFLHPKHSEQSRAALFLHEFLYSMARELGQTDSSNTRQGVGWLMQNDPKTNVGDVLFQLDSLGLTTKLDGLKKMTAEARLNLPSKLAHLVSDAQFEFKDFWNDTSFRAGPNGRTEAEIIADARALLPMIAEPTEFKANQAVAYLNKLSTPDAIKLRNEAQTLVNARAAEIQKRLIAGLEKENLIGFLNHVSYLNDSQRAFLTQMISEDVVNQLVAIAKNTFTFQEVEIMRGNAGPIWKFPIYSYGEFSNGVTSDGTFDDSYYGLEEIILKVENDNYKNFGFFELPMPTL